MSDSSRVQLAAIEESTWGTTPASALQAIRYNSENLGLRKETQRSEEVRSDRQTTDIVEVGKNTDGGFDFEASAGAHDMFFEGLMNNSFSSSSSFSGSVTAQNSDNSFNSSGFPSLVAGQFVLVTGMTNAANNGWFEVVSATSSKITVTGASLTDEGPTASVTVSDSTLVNGTTEKSYTLEKYFSDITQYYAVKGCRVDSLSLTIASRQRVTGTFQFMGSQGVMAQATAGSGAYSAAPTGPVMNASTNVARVTEGGAALGAGVYVQSLEINFNNNTRVVDGVGSDEAVAIGTGRFNVTGTMNVLFEDEVIFEKYLNHTQTAIAAGVNDVNGGGYHFSLPAVYYTNADVTGVGNDDEVTANLEFEAIMHPTQGIMARIDTA